MNCPICNYKKSLTCKITLPTFEHRNLTKISNYLFLKQCIFCKIIYNSNIKNILSISKKIFLSSKDYNFSLKNNIIKEEDNIEDVNKINSFKILTCSMHNTYYTINLQTLNKTYNYHHAKCINHFISSG
jgi:hypothetical protein